MDFVFLGEGVGKFANTSAVIMPKVSSDRDCIMAFLGILRPLSQRHTECLSTLNFSAINSRVKPTFFNSNIKASVGLRVDWSALARFGIAQINKIGLTTFEDFKFQKSTHFLKKLKIS